MAGVDVLTQVKQSFTTFIEDVQPLILSGFIAWLDLKVAQYKTFGYIVLDETEEEINLKKQQIFFLHKGKRIIPSTPRSGCELDSDTSSVKTLEISVEREAGETAKVLSWQGRRTLKCNSDEISPDNLESNGASKLRHSQENLAEQTGSDNILGLLSSLDDPAVSQSTLQGPSRNILCATRSKADTDGALALSDWASGELSANEKERFQIKVEPVDNAAADEDVDVGFDAEMDDVDSPSFKEDFSFEVSADSVTSNKEEDTLGKQVIVKVDVQKKQRQNTENTQETEDSTESNSILSSETGDKTNRKQGQMDSTKVDENIEIVTEHLCHNCGRCFQTRSGLHKHVKFKHRDPLYLKHTCDVCGRKFTEGHVLRAHQITQHGRPGWKCQHCDKSFTRKESLLRHQTVHSKTKGFLCPVCGRQFTRKDSVKEHMMHVHPAGQPFHYMCKEAGCYAKFKTRTGLRKHTIFNH